MRTITDREKLILVSSAMGQEIKTAQATTQIVFDTLNATNADSLIFFQGANTRALPNTNLNTNKLPYKNNLVIDFISFKAFNSEEQLLNFYQDARFTLTIGSQDVLKDILLWDSVNLFPQNYSAESGIVAFIPKTKLVIPADTTFKVTLNGFAEIGEPIRCSIKGYGTIKGGTTY